MSKTPGSEPKDNSESGDVPTVSVVSINPIRSMSSAWRQAVAQRAHRFRQLREVVRLKPFDVSTPEGQSRERYRRVALTTITSVFAKSVALLTMFISVPLTVNYLGTERFGLWMTVSSLIAFLVFADFGIGNGLLNGIAEASGKDDEELAQKYVSSAFHMMLGMAFLVALVYAMASPWIRWEWVFNLSSEQAVKEAGPSVSVFVGCFVANLVLGTVQRIQLGYQQGFITNLWQIVGSVTGLIGVLLVIHFRGGLPWLVMAMAGAPAISTGLNWIQFFASRGRRLLPQRKHFDWSVGRQLVSVGFIFMLLNVLALNWFQTDNVVIAQVLGTPAVAGYAIAQKLFSVVLVAQFVIVPLWPAYGEAMARSDFAWARRTLNRALGYSIGVTVAVSLPLLLFGRQAIALWIGPDHAPTFVLMFGLTILNVLMMIAGNLSSLLVHGASLRGQLGFYAAASVGALLLKILLAFWFGVAGVVWGTVLAFGLIYTPLALRMAYRATRIETSLPLASVSESRGNPG